MPSDALTVAVTTGLGVSVLAGILTGICYFITYGCPHSRGRKLVTPWHCSICGEQFRSIQGVLEIEKVVTCVKCKTKVCRIKCSRNQLQNGWICLICQQPENWFQGLLKSIHLRKDWTKSMDFNNTGDLSDGPIELRKKEREQVRDYIEKLVESIVGGNLDDINVSNIYDNKKYNSIIVRYHSDLSKALTTIGSALHISISNLPTTSRSPCSAHVHLKELIQRFVSEAAEVPSLHKDGDLPALFEELPINRTYEDILSTAIINKVIQISENETSLSNSTTNLTKTKTGNKEYLFGGETLGNKRKKYHSIYDDESSISSLDEWIRSDSSVGSAKYVDRMSLTIKQHIEDVSSSDEGSTSCDSYIPENSLHCNNENYYENWYFQKRNLTNSSSPTPVPMLVPNPVTEAKVLIGDMEIEQFSDGDSDYGDIEPLQDIKTILINSKTIIGGKNVIPHVTEMRNMLHTSKNILDASDKFASVSQTKPDIEQLSSYRNINDYATNPTNVEKYYKKIVHTPERNTEDISVISVESNIEQDMEYTEQYASQTFLKYTSPSLSKPQVAEDYDVIAVKVLNNCFKDIQQEKNVELEDSSSGEEKIKLVKGSYSEREQEKWKHSCVKIPHNPYSPENLKRRLSNKSSNSNTSIFGRDYYVKNAAKSTGTRSPSKLSEPEVVEYPVITDSDKRDIEDAIIPVAALVAVVNQEESITQVPITTAVAVNDISSDSDLSIERVYNLQSGKAFETKSNIKEGTLTLYSNHSQGPEYISQTFHENITSNTNTPIQSDSKAFIRSLTQNDDAITTSDNLSINRVPIGEFVDIVPYNENKFKATLAKFKSVTNIENNKNEQVFITKANKVMFERIKNVDENKYEIDNTTEVIEETKHSEQSLSDNREFSLEYSTDISDTDISITKNPLETDPEIIDLKEKQLVKDVLAKISRSYSNIFVVPAGKGEQAIFSENLESGVIQSSPIIEIDAIPSVKTLKELFDQENNTSRTDSKLIYSLTARSLSTHFKQELKNNEKSYLNNEESMEQKLADEETQQVVPVVDITKSRIAFYELLESNK